MWKKIGIILAVMVSISATTLAIFTQNPSSWLFVRDRGDRTSATVNDLLTAVGTTRIVAMIFDGGTWSFTNNVTFTTNVSVHITEGAYWDVSAGVTATLSTASFDADDYLCFTGSGVVTGTPSFLYRYPRWGNTNNFNIGAGLLLDGYTETDPIFTNWIATNATLAFAATAATNQAVDDSVTVKMTATTELFDSGADYDPALSRYVSPVTGFYIFNAVCRTSSTVVDQNTFQIQFYTNGVLVPNSKFRNYASKNDNSSVASSVVLNLVAGDYVETFVYQASGGSETMSGSEVRFDGFFIGE